MQRVLKVFFGSFLFLAASGCTGFVVPDSYPSGIIDGTEFATEPFRVGEDAEIYSASGVRSFEIPSDLSSQHHLAQCLPGTVILEFMAAPDGRPVNVRIIDSQPPGAYDRAAFLAIEQSRFEPTIVDGIWQPELQRRPVTFDVPESCD